MTTLYAVTPTITLQAGEAVGEYYSLDNVARYIMRAINTQSDTNAKAVALEGVIAAVADIGARHHFKWGAKKHTDIQLLRRVFLMGFSPHCLPPSLSAPHPRHRVPTAAH